MVRIGARHLLSKGNSVSRTGIEVIVESGVTSAVVEAGADTEVEVENRPYGYLKIRKVAGDNGEAIPNAVFEVYDGAGALAATLTTGKDGIATSGKLPAGTYTIKEKSVPADYVYSSTAYSITIRQPKQVATQTISNDVKPGKIKVIKTDSLDSTPIAGVVFEVVNAGGTVVATITTGAGRHGHDR